MATTKDYRLGEFTYPRGWFMIATAEEIADKPVPLHFFGREFVAYRGESGRVYLVDAYCPHMGTHLAKNTTSYVVKDKEHVEGDNIRCPYHGWLFSETVVSPAGSARIGPATACCVVLPSSSSQKCGAKRVSWPGRKRE